MPHLASARIFLFRDFSRCLKIAYKPFVNVFLLITKKRKKETFLAKGNRKETISRTCTQRRPNSLVVGRLHVQGNPNKYQVQHKDFNVRTPCMGLYNFKKIISRKIPHFFLRILCPVSSQSVD